jgi:HlyD family secretion protein
VEASGTVIPAFEGVLSSPVEARVERIVKRPGDVVKPGDEIVTLDTSAARLALGRLEDQLAKKLNEQEQSRIDLQRSLSDLSGQIESQRLDVEALRYRAEQNQKLGAEGLIAETVVKASEVEAKKAVIELRQLEERAKTERRSTAAQLAGLALDLATLRKERDEAARLLALAGARADRAGVVTWVVPQEGATVQRGEVIARLADLDSFRVEATVSDVHSARLRPGQDVRVVLDGEAIAGRLAAIEPTIENGAIRFKVDLAQPRHPKLRNSLRVDVLVITAARRLALRIAKGPFSQGGAVERVFVVTGEEAVKKSVRFGLSGYEHYEVLSGLQAGDEVILSDMSEYDHLDRIRIREAQ